MIMKISVFWDATPYDLVDKNQWFGGICCFYLQGRRAKHLYPQEVAVGAYVNLLSIEQFSQRHFFAAIISVSVEHIWLDFAKYEIVTK
jgi:hypothetical protein